MVKMLEADSGHLIIRKADGTEVFNTANPMPVRRGLVAYSGITIDMPDPPGTTYAANASFDIQTKWPTANTVTDIDLGPYVDTIAPGFIAAAIRARRTLVPTPLGNSRRVYQQLAQGSVFTSWQVWGGGSYLAEIIFDDNDPILGMRHLALAVKSGRWVIEARHSNVAFDSTFQSQVYSMHSTYEVDLEIEWGILK